MTASLLQRCVLLALAGGLSACSVLRPTVEAPEPAGNPQVLLLGEVHDNVQGHRLRYEALRKRVEAGWRPAIAMEQFDREQQGLLSKAQQVCLDADCIVRAAGSARWDWQQYRPVIELALAHKLPLIAVNLSRADASRVVRDGVASSFDPATVQAYKLDAPLPADIRRVQQKEIIDSHCNMLPENMVDGMVAAQVARDIWMAKLIRAQQPRDVVLIAGNGHVRKNVGVARWLNAVEPALSTRSIAYGEGTPTADQFDGVVKLPTQSRPDPCASMGAKS